MDIAAYEKYLKEEFIKYDSLCRRCGKCCGIDNDPCANLIIDEEGRCACRAYDVRLGPQKTASGKDFTCVPIKENIRRGFCNPDCAYVKAGRPK